MIETRLPINERQADALEAYFCEDYQQHWMLHENWKTHEHELRGYFESREEAITRFALLKQAFPSLGQLTDFRTLEDKDWKEAYKIHFKPWSDRGLHWVPIWEKDTYALPDGDQIVYLDPGMAFGTGNHETTRLCVRRLLDVRDALGERVSGTTVIDAGCGSGILAISAKKLGFGETYGFDNDPDSVRISLDNEILCGLEGAIEFNWADLNEGLEQRQGDVVLANILANILCDHAEVLCRAVAPAGVLVLSGILADEVGSVHEVFRKALQKVHNVELPMDSRTDGDWADLCYKVP